MFVDAFPLFGESALMPCRHCVLTFDSVEIFGRRAITWFQDLLFVKTQKKLAKILCAE